MSPAAIEELLHHPDRKERMRGLIASRALPLPDRFPLLCIAAKDEYTRIRYDAISQLATVGEVDRDTAGEILENCLNTDPEVDVRAAAADALGALRITSSYDSLIAAYKGTTEWLLQLSILAILGFLGDRRCFDLLVEATRQENSLLRIAGIRALGDLADPRALPILQSFIADPDWQIRHALTQAAANFGTEGQQLLQVLTEDRSEQVAETARLLLKGI